MAFRSLLLLLSLFCISLSVLAKSHSISINAPAILVSGQDGKGALQAILQRDRARFNRASGKKRPAAHQMKSAAVQAGADPIKNTMFYYTADVYVGAPAKKFTLLIDTGSGNSWIRKGYKASATTSKRTGDKISATYGLGYFEGSEYTDSVKLAGLTAKKYSISLATESEGFNDVGGILAMGPKALTQGNSDSDPKKQIPSFVETLFSQGAISRPVFSIYFQPTSLVTSQNGFITIGSTDSIRGVGTSFSVPKSKNKKVSRYWGLDVSLLYGNKVLGSGTAISDTGTTMMMMATQLYNRYFNIIAPLGAKYDDGTGLIAIRSQDVAKLPTFYLRLGSNKLALIGDAQFFPETDSVALGGRRGYRYGIISDSMSDLGDDVDVMIGAKVLERFLTSYDYKNGKMTFQPTKYTSQTYAQMGKLMRRSVNATVASDFDDDF